MPRIAYREASKEVCQFCDEPIAGNVVRGDYTAGSFFAVNAPFHPDCRDQYLEQVAESKAEHKQWARERRNKINLTSAETAVKHLRKGDESYEVFTLEERCKLNDREPYIQDVRNTRKLVRNAGVADDITFQEWWEGSTEIDYAKAQAEALAANQKQLRILRTVTYAKQIQVAFLKMPLEQAQLFARALLSDPGGKIAKLFELEAGLAAKKPLPSSTPKQLSVGRKKRSEKG